MITKFIKPKFKKFIKAEIKYYLNEAKDLIRWGGYAKSWMTAFFVFAIYFAFFERNRFKFAVCMIITWICSIFKRYDSGHWKTDRYKRSFDEKG